MPNDGSDPRIDVGEVVRSYSRRVLDEFSHRKREGGAGEESIDQAVRRVLSDRLPARYGVAEGVVVDTSGGQTKPFGALIFDRERLPILRGEDDVGFWPFESVYAVVEIRDKLTREELETAVQNVSAFKALEREPITSASATGFTVSGEVANPPLALLIAREHAEDLLPSETEFNDIVKSVTRDRQLDAYCVISGPLGVLGREVPRLGLLLGFSDKGPTKIYHFTFGAGALAAFLLMVTGILNKIRLGEPALVHYLRSASP
ncbi:MAG TPA: DUF6602 domain-containing protein [Polyangiaceae bacterium]|jgi:hypothetical protein